jgi:hypothetical protein
MSRLGREGRADAVECLFSLELIWSYRFCCWLKLTGEDWIQFAPTKGSFRFWVQSRRWMRVKRVDREFQIQLAFSFKFTAGDGAEMFSSLVERKQISSNEDSTLSIVIIASSLMSQSVSWCTHRRSIFSPFFYEEQLACRHEHSRCSRWVTRGERYEIGFTTVTSLKGKVE